MSRAFLKAVFEIKIKLNFYFHTSLCASKGFMKALKAFIKPFEAPQRSVKIKIQVIFISIQETCLMFCLNNFQFLFLIANKNIQSMKS